MSSREQSERMMRPVAAGLSLGAIFVAAVGIALDAASELSLSDDQTSAWILIAWGLPSLIALLLTLRFRQPLVTTGNIFILIFVLLLGAELTWPELVGAAMAAGLIVLLLGLSGLTNRLAGVLPPSIVFGLLAGAVLGLLAESFTVLGTSTLLVGSTFAAYFVSRATFGDRVPALLVAIGVGLLVAILASEAGAPPSPAWPQVTATLPEFSVKALLTATPVLVVFITLQANAPSIVFLRSEGYEAPERTLSVISGAGTMAGSLFGPLGVSLSLPATALVAGPDAGERDIRRWAAYVAGGAGLMVALAAGFAAELIAFIPAALLDAIIGLAVLGILAQSLTEITRGPLILGPLVAFGVSVSNIELLGFGRFFWAIVLGMSISLLVEREGWRTLLVAGRGPDLPDDS